MRQKTTLILFLLLGSLITAISCNTKRVDYWVKADWIYINNSSHNIRIEGIENFSLPISGTYTIYEEGEGPRDITAESYIAPLKPGETKIIFDDDKEIIVSDGITDRANYQAEKIEIRYYRFTYTFTDEDYPEE